MAFAADWRAEVGGQQREHLRDNHRVRNGKQAERADILKMSCHHLCYSGVGTCFYFSNLAHLNGCVHEMIATYPERIPTFLLAQEIQAPLRRLVLRSLHVQRVENTTRLQAAIRRAQSQVAKDTAKN